MEQEEAKGCRKLCLSGEERLAEQRKLRARFLFLFFFFQEKTDLWFGWLCACLERLLLAGWNGLPPWAQRKWRPS